MHCAWLINANNALRGPPESPSVVEGWGSGVGGEGWGGPRGQVWGIFSLHYMWFFEVTTGGTYGFTSIGSPRWKLIIAHLLGLRGHIGIMYCCVFTRSSSSRLGNWFVHVWVADVTIGRHDLSMWPRPRRPVTTAAAGRNESVHAETRQGDVH